MEGSGSRATRQLGGVRAPPSRRLGDAGSSQLIGFLIALFVFVGAIVALFAFYPQSPNEERLEKSGLNSQTLSAMDLIVSGAGNTAGGLTDWQSDPDNVTRFGLTVEGRPSVLDGKKASSMSKGALQANSTNQYLDYPEAKAALGLDLQDFHLRSYPVFPGLGDPTFTKIADLKVAYVGDYAKVGSGPVSYSVPYVATVQDRGTFVDVGVLVANDGTEATVFQATFDVHLKDGSIVDVQNTGRVAIGLSETMTLRLFKTTGWTWADTSKKVVNVTVTDTQKTVAQFTVNITSDMASGGLSGNPIASLVVDTHKSYYTDASQSDDKARLAFTAQSGTGALIDGQDVTIEVYNSTGSKLVTFNEKVRKNGQNQVDWDTPDGVEDRYNMTIRYNSVNSSERMEVTDLTVGEFRPAGDDSVYEETGGSVYERVIVYELVETFKNYSYVDRGDAYPDIKDVMNNDLANNLSTYDVLVVGSNVDQNAMTSAAAKYSVRDWVLGGGTLVVLGSDAQAVQWLQPLFHSSIATASGGIGVPDPTNPILHVPEELNYLNYVDNQTAWRLKAADRFTHVVAKEQSVGGSDAFDSLTISQPGAFGNGTIILTSWRPHILMTPQEFLEAKKLLYNFLAQAYGAGGSIFIDYGPVIPSDATVSASTRLVTITPIRLPRTLVEVRLVLYLFQVGR
ncbi:MAG: hypothetical protein HY556_06985 [Euryarchaeota archaeon]|nr:hypothetical protein [Euryarchaeota archaeon]